MSKQYMYTNAAGNKYYYKDKAKTILHREDGPAIEYTNGSKAWFVNGVPHRMDGPAYEYANGTREWYVNGRLHRLDGPAIEWASGDKAWYVNDIFIMRGNEEGKVVDRMR